MKGLIGKTQVDYATRNFSNIYPFRLDQARNYSEKVFREIMNYKDVHTQNEGKRLVAKMPRYILGFIPWGKEEVIVDLSPVNSHTKISVTGKNAGLIGHFLDEKAQKLGFNPQANPQPSSQSGRNQSH
jgi:hypothetical protein